MKIGPISNVNFRAAYAVIGTKKQMNSLYNSFPKEKSEGQLLTIPATSIYDNSEDDDYCANSVKNGKHVFFFVTGKNVEDVLSERFHWSSVADIKQHVVQDVYEIKDDKEACEYFKSKIEEDWEKDSPHMFF